MIKTTTIDSAISGLCSGAEFDRFSWHVIFAG